MNSESFAALLNSLDTEEFEGPLADALDTVGSVVEALRIAAIHRLQQVADGDLELEQAEDAADNWDDGLSLLEDRFGRRIVDCGNPSGLYEMWGLRALALSGRGYVYDYGEADSSFRVRARWTPPDDDTAYERAVLEAWKASWEEIGLPPFVAQCWDGPGDLIFRTVDSLVATDTDAWNYLVQELPVLWTEAISAVEDRDWEIFGLKRRDLSWESGLRGRERLAAARIDTDQRAGLVVLYLASRHGCP